MRTSRETSPTGFTFSLPGVVTFSRAPSLSSLRSWERQLAVREWLSNVFLLACLTAMLWSVSHSSTFTLVSTTEMCFYRKSLFRWTSEHSLCFFQSHQIPFWTLSGFRLCVALPLSIKRSVGAGVWHCHKTWWETIEPPKYYYYYYYYKAFQILQAPIFFILSSFF